MSLHMINICGPNEGDKRCFKIEENIFHGNGFAIPSKGWKYRYESHDGLERIRIYH